MKVCKNFLNYFHNNNKILNTPIITQGSQDLQHVVTSISYIRACELAIPEILHSSPVNWKARFLIFGYIYFIS